MHAILLIDHGSTYKPANDMLSEVAALLKKKSPHTHIEIAHMELASPTIEDGFRACVKNGATHIIAHPYMLSPGRHATTDIPNLVKAISQKFSGISYKVTKPLGIHPLIADIILDRITEI